jgi:hypothetical protein
MNSVGSFLKMIRGLSGAPSSHKFLPVLDPLQDIAATAEVPKGKKNLKLQM